MNLKTPLPTTSPGKLIQERQQILDAIATTDREMTEARASLDTMRAEVGEAEANAALDARADSTNLAKLRAAAREFVETLENLSDRSTALTSKLRSKNLAILEFETTLDAERHKLLEKRYVRWLEGYRKSARAFQQVLLTGHAIAHVYGNGLLEALGTAVASDPEEQGVNLLSTSAVRRPNAVDRYDVDLAWEVNPASAREHAAAREEIQEVDAALKVIQEIRASGSWR